MLTNNFLRLLLLLLSGLFVAPVPVLVINVLQIILGATRSLLLSGRASISLSLSLALCATTHTRLMVMVMVTDPLE